jgi:hypothetical protein
MDDDLAATARQRPRIRRCNDCATEIIDTEVEHCRSCAETRRLLPRFLSLTIGRAHVRALLAEQDSLDSSGRGSGA